MSQGENYTKVMSDFEKKLLVQTLKSCNWNREKAAALLGLPMRTFYRKTKKHCLKRHDLPNLT